ncbi:MAG: serine hydrolase [Bacteroidetes bacterium]|nr:serine hydrolase [Bacteroidota bacterium]
MKRSFFCILLFSVYFLSLKVYSAGHSNAVTSRDSAWVDSVFKTLSLDDKIAQLMIMRAYSDKDSSYNDSICWLVKNQKVGGICFFRGTPYRQANLTNIWNENVTPPLLIATDAEWGLGMRLDSAFSFPKQMELGAIDDDSLIYRMASCIALDCKRMGVNLNFAPVVDINNNPLNPVINVRSFGENKNRVAIKALMYMNGMQDNGVMATAKHFPGHGDTDADSHLTLPVIRYPQKRIDSIELFPFRQLISQGVDGIMVGHLCIPAIDSTPNQPATLSRNIITSLLKEKLGFHGYVITDALDMQGVSKYYKPGDIEVKALLAGNDILLLPQNLSIAIAAIRKAVDSCLIPPELIDEKCKKILFLKYHAGLARSSPVDTKNLYKELNRLSSTILNREIAEKAITLVKDENGLLPVNTCERKKIACVVVGDTNLTSFEKRLETYAPMRFFNLPQSFSKKIMDSLICKLDSYDLIILGIERTSSYPEKRFGISNSCIEFVDSVVKTKTVILDLFGNPYSLNLFTNANRAAALMISYQDTRELEEISAQAIFGGINISGKLPVSVAGFSSGTGIAIIKSRFAYVIPEEMGISSASLAEIDSIAMEGIKAKAYPGCQILFARNGKVFYQRSFGTPRYEDTVKVNNDDLYDLASLTKVAGTTLAIMKLYELEKINPDEKLSVYLPELKGSNKEKMTIREVMAHQAGLQAWIPFYKKTLMDRCQDTTVYRTVPSEDFPYRVAEKMFINRNYPDSLYQVIIRSPLRSTKDYLYSDLGFYLLKRVVEKLSGEPFETFLEINFYEPLGLTTLCFSPRNHFPLSRIIPTENDQVFRGQILQGDVHDPGAAMLGGVSGHAGLFSNANDLAIILQMLLNRGNYGGRQYLNSETIDEFTRVQFPANGNRRGMGFDKPQNTYSSDGPTCKSASLQSFGHSGFTGTYIWADPVNNFIYIFLSNRVYPDASNQKLLEMNIRTRIHQAMYDILERVK